MKVISFMQDHCTPLYVASANGFNDVVKTLIAGNADVNCICKVSCVPVMCMYAYVTICIT